MLLFVSSCCKFGVLAVSAVAVENDGANAVADVHCTAVSEVMYSTVDAAVCEQLQ